MHNNNSARDTKMFISSYQKYIIQYKLDTMYLLSKLKLKNLHDKRSKNIILLYNYFNNIILNKCL